MPILEDIIGLPAPKTSKSPRRRLSETMSPTRPPPPPPPAPPLPRVGIQHRLTPKAPELPAPMKINPIGLKIAEVPASSLFRPLATLLPAQPSELPLLPPSELPPPPPSELPNPPPASTLTISHPITLTQLTPPPPALLIGLSGSTGSGKTTISHLLPLLFPKSNPFFALHLNDFLIPKDHPTPHPQTRTLATDTPSALDYPSLLAILTYAKTHNHLPPTFHTLQPEAADRAHALALVSPTQLDSLRATLAAPGLLRPGQAIGIVEGDLLFHNARLRSLLDVKILLRTTRALARARYFAQPEYLPGPTTTGVTGREEKVCWWRTEKYFDEVVWRNFERVHGVLFVGGDVEGRIEEGVCADLGISVIGALEAGVGEVLGWVVGVLVGEVERGVGGDEEDGDGGGEGDEEGWVGWLRRVLYELL
ncbi:ribosylnicotinamide kinase [Toensbergia leucococca]|nr:ribosylnicotinamide kinase [Toensbergia leucococca]